MSNQKFKWDTSEKQKIENSSRNLCVYAHVCKKSINDRTKFAFLKIYTVPMYLIHIVIMFDNDKLIDICIAKKKITV